MCHRTVPGRLPWSLLLLLALAGAGCRNEGQRAPGAEAAPELAAVSPLPPLRLTRDTTNLLLTWVDPEGDFHVAHSIDEIPEDRRDPVRVVVTTGESGTGQAVYVADLRAPGPDGSYGVRVIPRSEWDNIGAERRQARMEAMAPKLKPPESGAPGESKPPGASEPAAIIYGAEWCKPCHDAETFLKSLGVQVTKKDIEESPAAQAEMRQKLAKINKHGASIPVIDLMGKIFVGFNPGVLKQVLETAKRQETL